MQITKSIVKGERLNEAGVGGGCTTTLPFQFLEENTYLSWYFLKQFQIYFQAFEGVWHLVFSIFFLGFKVLRPSASFYKKKFFIRYSNFTNEMKFILVVSMHFTKLS